MDLTKLKLAPPWKAHYWGEDEYGPGIWDVTTDRGNPADEYDVLEDPDEETARILAAAPDLLAACHEAIQILDALSADHVVAYDMLRAAIAKATGTGEGDA